MNNSKKVFKYDFWAKFGLALFLYVSIAIAFSSIPNTRVYPKVVASLITIDGESDNSRNSFLYEDGFLNRSAEKKLLVDVVTVSGHSSIYSGLEVNSNFESWQGNLFITKFFLCFFNIVRIRYIFKLFLYLCIAILISILIRKTDFSFTVCYVMALFSMNFSEVWFSFLAYYNILFMVIAAIFALYNFERIKSDKCFMRGFLFYTGSIACFIDPFNAPFLSLYSVGSIILFDALKNDYFERVFDSFKFMFKIILFWGMGYFLTLLAKWIIVSILYKEIIIFKGFARVGERITKDFINEICTNVTIFAENNDIGKKILLATMAILLLVYLFLLIMGNKGLKPLIKALPMLVFGLIALAFSAFYNINYTCFRIVGFSLLCILTFAIFTIDFDMLKKRIHYMVKGEMI